MVLWDCEAAIPRLVRRSKSIKAVKDTFVSFSHMRQSACPLHVEPKRTDRWHSRPTSTDPSVGQLWSRDDRFTDPCIGPVIRQDRKFSVRSAGHLAVISSFASLARLSLRARARINRKIFIQRETDRYRSSDIFRSWTTLHPRPRLKDLTNTDFASGAKRQRCDLSGTSRDSRFCSIHSN